METLNLGPVVHIGVDIHYVRERLIDGALSSTSFDDEDKKEIRERLKTVISDMGEYCELLDAPEVCALLNRYKEKPPEQCAVFDVLRDAFWAVVSSKSVLFLDKKQTAFLEDVSPFGDNVSVKAFPDAAADIESASRSLAFDLPLAAVFHLMRAMEVSVGTMATTLGVTNATEIEWGKILSALDDKIKLLPKDVEKKLWSEARSNLWHVKECWRNDTMHPRRNYTQAQAEEIFRAVRTFMAQLSELLLQKRSS